MTGSFSHSVNSCGRKNVDVPCLVSSSSKKPSGLPGNAARASHPSTGRPLLISYPRYACEVKDIRVL